MDLATLRGKLLALVPDAEVPERVPGDDLYAFAFAGRALGPPVTAAVEAGSLAPLAALLEEVFTDGDDDLVDAVAIRVVHDRLVARPAALEAAWPYLGPRTRKVAGKFQALLRACAEREAAAGPGGE
jgi:hypothetical protein